MADALVVVDTDVFIWLTRGKQEKAAPYVPLVEGKRIVLSFASVAELWFGAERLGYNATSRRRLESDIGRTTVVAPDNELTHAWATLRAEARGLGHALGQPSKEHDAWIAATAHLYELPLVTDDQHFDGFLDSRFSAHRSSRVRIQRAASVPLSSTLNCRLALPAPARRAPLA